MIERKGGLFLETVEMTLLEVLNDYSEISQREISSKVGISLGMVNILINKFAKVGLVKIERLNGNKIRYMLTPQGFAVLSKKTIAYISKSYTAMLQIKEQMKQVLEENFTPHEAVTIFGNHDEVSAVLEEVLKSQGRDYHYITEPDASIKFIHWQPELTMGIFLLC
jgi:DNA-binding MarR family transcriptional regulator